jgi:hypothetical protein
VLAVDVPIDTAGSGITVTIGVEDKGALALHVALIGSAELPAVGVMERVVAELHREAQARGVAAVVMDFTDLEFMNSSCFKSLLTWVNDVIELEESKRYQIRLRSNPKILWQRRSLHVLKTMATDIISIES